MNETFDELVIRVPVGDPRIHEMIQAYFNRSNVRTSYTVLESHIEVIDGQSVKVIDKADIHSFSIVP